MRSKFGFRLPFLSALFCSAFSLLSFSACSHGRQLVAKDGSHRMLARDDDKGVTVVLTSGAAEEYAWSEDFSVLHFMVVNHGTDTIQLSPGDFELVDERGFRYLLYNVGGYFHPAGAASNGSNYSAGRSNRFHTISSNIDDLARIALPWGELLPGTQMRGFLYFERAEESSNQPTLIWRPQSSGRPVTIAFKLYAAKG